jgi:hypothetical protein
MKCLELKKQNWTPIQSHAAGIIVPTVRQSVSHHLSFMKISCGCIFTKMHCVKYIKIGLRLFFQSSLCSYISRMNDLNLSHENVREIEHMWLVSQGNPYVMQQTCQCTFLKGFSITNNILAKKKFFIFANFFKWRFLFYLVKTKDPGVKKKISPILMKLEIRNP